MVVANYLQGEGESNILNGQCNVFTTVPVKIHW